MLRDTRLHAPFIANLVVRMMACTVSQALRAPAPTVARPRSQRRVVAESAGENGAGAKTATVQKVGWAMGQCRRRASEPIPPMCSTGWCLCIIGCAQETQ